MSTRRLVAVAGPTCSGKMPLARSLMREDPGLVLVHRDHLRASLESEVSEADITMLMADLARGILRIGRSPIVVAWNLEPTDRVLWNNVAASFGVPLSWLDVRSPVVAAMIPTAQEEASAD